MAVSSTTRKAGPFTGNGVTSVFPFDFKVFAAADLYVVKRAPDGTETVLVYGSDFTVNFNADQDVDPGGSITLQAPLPANYILAATSAIDPLQGTVLTNNGGFYPNVLNDVHDKQVILSQQLAVDIDRSVQVPLGESGPQLPMATLRASKLAVFDSNGDFDTSRDLASFDQDVVNTANAATQANQDKNAALAAKVAAQTAQQSAETLFNNFDLAANLVQLNTDVAKNQAIAAATDAQTTLAAIQAFYAANGASLSQRVDLIENPIAATLAPYVGGVLTTQAEYGQSLAVTLTRTLSRDVGTCVIDQGVGTISYLAGTVSGIATGAAVTGTKTWTMTATPAPAGNAKVVSTTLSFFYRFFAGTYATSDLHTKTAAQIRTALLAGSALQSNASRTFSVDAGSGGPQWVYFAVPAGWSLSAFTVFGFDELSNLTVSNVNINDFAGNPVAYHLYRLPNALTGVIPMVANA